MVYRITYPRSDLKVKVNEFAGSARTGANVLDWYSGHGKSVRDDGRSGMSDTEEAAVVAKLVHPDYPSPRYIII